MAIQYMTTSGVWKCSCQSEQDKPDPALIEAPADANGFHGMEGLKWNGTSWIEIQPVPESCTAFQGRLALGQARCQAIASMINMMPWESKQAWEYATTWKRKSDLLLSLGKAFNLTEEEVDDLFRLAVTLEV